MKRIIAVIVMASAVVLGFAARKGLKSHITEVSMGKYEDVELGNGTLRLKKIMGKELQPKDFTVVLYPRRGVAALQYKKLVAEKDRILFDYDARRALANAFESYKVDFEEKKLDRKKTKFEPKYGFARSRIEWGPLQYTSYADPKIGFGYVFVGKSPYFCINVPGTKSDQKVGDVQVEYGGVLLYFTRSQAEDLVKAMEEESIGAAIESQTVKLPSDDEYDGFDSGYEEASDEVKPAEKPSKSSRKTKKKVKAVEPVEVDNSDYEEDQ